MDHPHSSHVRSRLESGRESYELIGEHGQSWEEEAERPKRQHAARPRQPRDPMIRSCVPAVVRQLSVLGATRKAMARPIAKLIYVKSGIPFGL
jgi:hypothetical protein